MAFDFASEQVVAIHPFNAEQAQLTAIVGNSSRTAILCDLSFVCLIRRRPMPQPALTESETPNFWTSYCALRSDTPRT
jgi:hypothetical protein